MLTTKMPEQKTFVV